MYRQVNQVVIPQISQHHSHQHSHRHYHPCNHLANHLANRQIFRQVCHRLCHLRSPRLYRLCNQLYLPRANLRQCLPVNLAATLHRFQVRSQARNQPLNLRRSQVGSLLHNQLPSRVVIPPVNPPVYRQDNRQCSHRHNQRRSRRHSHRHSLVYLRPACRARNHRLNRQVPRQCNPALVLVQFLLLSRRESRAQSPALNPLSSLLRCQAVNRHLHLHHSQH